MKIQALATALTVCLIAMTAGCVELDPSELEDGEEMDEAVSETQQKVVYCPEYASYYPIEDCDGGGGGGGGGSYPPPSPPSTDTSSSYLDTAARTYLTQVGVANSYQVGGTLWVDACVATAYQGAGTFNDGVASSCTYGPPPGWIILEKTHAVTANWSNRGTYSVSLINGSISTSSAQLGSKFNGAIDLAVSVGDVSASTKLNWEYQRLNSYSWAFNGTGQNIYVYVKANGGLFQASKITVSTRAKLLRVY